MKKIKSYNNFILENDSITDHYGSLPEIEDNLRHILYELEDDGFICRLMVSMDRITINIGNGCTTGFSQFMFRRIQPVCLRIVKYIMMVSDKKRPWQVKVIKVINNGVNLEIIERLSNDYLKSKVYTDDEDISGGQYSNEFRIVFTR